MISVIVPVYNVEQYLDECINSILNQAYKEFELILVDDGSTDDSGNMCDKYAEVDKRIKVIHKKNGGLSDARNVGTKAAVGEAITYIDSDDIVSEMHLEILYNIWKKENADVSVVGMEQFYTSKAFSEQGRNDKVIVLSGIEALEHMLYQDLLDTSACAILIRTSIAKNENNMFPVGKYHEDDLTTYKYYAMAKTVAISKKITYFYRQRTGSIMHVCGKAISDELDAADNLVVVCKNNYPHLVKAAHSKKFSNYCQALINLDADKQYNTEAYRRITRYIKSTRWNIVFDNKCRLKNRIAAAICCIGISVFVFLGLIKKNRLTEDTT